MYLRRNIDKALKDWAASSDYKPLMLRGARQVGKSTAVRNLGGGFESFVEINFERNPEYAALFKTNLDVKRITSQISALVGQKIEPGKTLLFIDEIQACPEAIMSLRFFREDMPKLHVIAAGSLLEFALDEIPTFGVGRIHSMYMYPMTFDEFLEGCGEDMLLEARNNATIFQPLPQPLHERLVERLRTYLIVGGMPEAVATWVETHDYLKCQIVQDDIVMGYEADFPKYRRKVDPMLLQATFRSVALQMGSKFVYSQVPGNYKAEKVREALDLLAKAGLVIPVVHTAANGIPLGSESDPTYRKMLLLDTGLLLRLLDITIGNRAAIATQILTSADIDLVNKVSVVEMLAGTEMLYNNTPNLHHELYYWQRQSKNSLAEVDYVTVIARTITPVEVKASRQGGMKSLWALMRLRNITKGVRMSLENFGEFSYEDQESGDVRRILICPLYAVSQLAKLYAEI